MNPAEIMAHSPAPAPERLPAGFSDAIIAQVAERHKVDVRDILGPGRLRTFTVPRQEAMALIWATGRVSTTWIGRKFRRDHTTVIHGIRAHEARISAAAEKAPA